MEFGGGFCFLLLSVLLVERLGRGGSGVVVQSLDVPRILTGCLRTMILQSDWITLVSSRMGQVPWIEVTTLSTFYSLRCLDRAPGKEGKRVVSVIII